MTERHYPYNPYRSFVIMASAGSGKTYQLSRRFLFLVGAGADPSKILTVTFTNKAAGEMQERILSAAKELLTDENQRMQYDMELQRFYKETKQQSPEAQIVVPRCGLDTAKVIIDASQRLKISTIDSLFLNWVQKFPYEGLQLSPGSSLPMGSQMLDSLQQQELDKKSWDQFTHSLFGDAADQPEILRELIADHGLKAISHKIDQLTSHDTFLWFLQNSFNHEGLLAHTHASDGEQGSEETILQDISQDLNVLFALTSKAVEFSEALAAGTIDALQKCGFLTKAFTVSSKYLRGKKREAHSGVIDSIEDKIRGVINNKRLQQLDAQGRLFYSLYKGWQYVREELKKKSGWLEFKDLAKAAFHIQCLPEGEAARFFIHRQIHHVLLDEFQDTSRLQWQVFQNLIDELLSGDGEEVSSEDSGLAKSLFVVGDLKQSIYGFREAEPEVLQEASLRYKDYGVRTLTMEHSYRTAPVILDVVNAFYENWPIEGFNPHATATDNNHHPVIPNTGGVFVAELIEDERQAFHHPIDAEAHFIASYIKSALDGRVELDIYDKSIEAFRPPKAHDFCLLYRDATHAHRYEAALEEVGIACQREEERGFFERSEIKDLLALLKFLSVPGDRLALATVLRSPIFACDGETLAQFLEGLFAVENEKALKGGLIKTFSEKGAALAKLLDTTHKISPHQLILNSIESLEILTAYQKGVTDNEAALAAANIKQFIQVCLDQETAGYNDVYALSQRLQDLSGEDAAGRASLAANAVSLMTMHKSKGMEFPFIILVNMHTQWKNKDRYWLKLNESGSELKDKGMAYVGTKPDWPIDHPAFERMLETINLQTQAENARLLYVAMTRPKQYLLVTGVPSRQKLEDLTYFDKFHKIMAEKPDDVRRTFEIGGRTVQAYLSKDSRNIKKVALVTDETRNQPATKLQKPIASYFDYIPYESRIVNPHESVGKSVGEVEDLVKDQPSGSPFSEWALVHGLYVHAGLEAFVKGDTFDGDSFWVQLCTEHQLMDSERGEQAQRSAMGELQQCLAENSQFRKLLTQYSEAHAELSILQHRVGEIVSGKIDLFLRNPGADYLIVDYKSSHVESELLENEGKLIRLCQMRGYTDQIENYRGVVRDIYPTEKPKQAIYFTKYDQFVFYD